MQDGPDGYRFQYPFGWQEVTVAGADVVYKDIVEPLETVSVTMLGTDKKDVSEYGSVEEVRGPLSEGGGYQRLHQHATYRTKGA
jgi:photosystem II oxygen-evolving enhancer protein 2